MKFYDYRFAPSPRKVRLFIEEKGIDIPSVDVDLRSLAQRDPTFLAVNPGATVPVLELDDGTRITESLAICHYLERLYPEPNLLGVDAKEQALVLMWNDVQTFEGYLGLQEVLRNGNEAFRGRALGGPIAYEQIPELVDRGRRRAAVFFDKLDTHLGDSPFIVGERFTYADIVGFVYLGFATRAMGTDETQGRAALKRWSDAIAARPAIARWSATQAR